MHANLKIRFYAIALSLAIALTSTLGLAELMVASAAGSKASFSAGTVAARHAVADRS